MPANKLLSPSPSGPIAPYPPSTFKSVAENFQKKGTINIFIFYFSKISSFARPALKTSQFCYVMGRVRFDFGDIAQVKVYGSLRFKKYRCHISFWDAHLDQYLHRNKCVFYVNLHGQGHRVHFWQAFLANPNTYLIWFSAANLKHNIEIQIQFWLIIQDLDI